MVITKYSEVIEEVEITEKDFASNQILGQSPAMQEILQQVKTVAPFNSSVLITGETGTGKELIARRLHAQSRRSKAPFVAINCAAIPEQLLEDELFGHIKGAFTGAQNPREGRFEQANGGTLFLDEIGDMNLALQAKLLRVLQERKFEKLGSSKTINVDVRIVAATSANLEERIQQGTFRPDLYYRLNIINIHLPPVKERKEDVLILAEYFLKRFCITNGLPTKALAIEAQKALISYDWPGNVRQLQNAMERMAILTAENTVIKFNDLPKEVKNNFELTNKQAPQTVFNNHTINKYFSNFINKNSFLLPEGGVNFDSIVTEVERELLCQSLRKTHGNKMQAAKLLKMKRTTFVEKLKRLGLSENLVENENYLMSKTA
jgi:DNA-binding NtrC family response regulator